MLWSVYPRWRGEHTSVIAAAFYIIGLSPLARGTPDIEIPELNITRFIPAGAGNTTSCPLSLFQLPVYPRWRGEHASSTATRKDFFGLSPLARGTHRARNATPGKRRFIPAGAGNTYLLPPAEYVRSVYPRWRGEHAPASHPGIAAAGLSPLARGTHRRADVSRGPGRFIPAGAGNTVPAIW